MRCQDGMAAAIDKAKHIVLGDFVAETNAARTKDAALVVQCHPRSEFHRFWFLHLVFLETGFRRAVLATQFPQLAFPGLIANRTVEWMIDQKKFHHAALAFAHQRRSRSDTHAFSHVLRAGDLRSRHPIDDWFAILAELRFTIRSHLRHAHFDETHAAVTRGTQLLVITVARHITTGAFARFDDASPFREPMPDAINLNIK